MRQVKLIITFRDYADEEQIVSVMTLCEIKKISSSSRRGRRASPRHRSLKSFWIQICPTVSRSYRTDRNILGTTSFSR